MTEEARMTVTMQDVRSALDPEEPDYAAAAELGAEALPHLKTLVQGDDAMLASKAASLAAFIGGAGAADVLGAAAAHTEPPVRAVAAYGAQMLPQDVAEPIVLQLLDDDEPSVSKRAVKSAAAIPTDEVRGKLAEIADAPDRAEFLRDTASQVLGDIQ